MSGYNFVFLIQDDVEGPEAVDETQDPGAAEEEDDQQEDTVDPEVGKFIN